MIDINRLNALQPGAMLALRLYVGGFLIWGVWDNITSAARMAEFEAFLAGLNCPLPAIAAPVSVWVQLAVGAALIAGVLTRWAGLLLSLNFVVAVALLWGGGADARGLFPPAILIFVGLVLATHGPGAWSLDARRGKH